MLNNYYDDVTSAAETHNFKIKIKVDHVKQIVFELITLYRLLEV